MAHITSHTLYSTLVSLLIYLLPVTEMVKSENCYNNGTFTMDGNQWKCICPHPFIGRYCEDYACVNGLSTGFQYDEGSKFLNKRCLCDTGWTGSLCSTSLHNRCGDNGIEVNGKCECNKNFVGDRCQYVTKCVNGQLYNGRCACHYGWSGDHCDQIVCKQGRADESNTNCICPLQYRGKYCDFCAEPASSPPPECAAINGRQMIQIKGYSIVIILAFVIVIALLVLGIVFCLLRQKDASSMKQSKKKTARKRTSGSDVEMRLVNVEGENRPLHGIVSQNNGNEIAADTSSFFHPPPPPYHTLASAEEEPNVPHKEESEAKAVATSSPSEVSFFLGEGNNIIETVEREPKKPDEQSDAVEK